MAARLLVVSSLLVLFAGCGGSSWDGSASSSASGSARRRRPGASARGTRSRGPRSSAPTARHRRQGLRRPDSAAVAALCAAEDDAAPHGLKRCSGFGDRERARSAAANAHRTPSFPPCRRIVPFEEPRLVGENDRLRSGVFARWVGIVALLGAISFLITFLTLIAGTGEDSVFGFGFFPGVLALVIWSIATSFASYRAVASNARKFVATEADT